MRAVPSPGYALPRPPHMITRRSVPNAIPYMSQACCTCSHIQGMFYRTSRMIQAGIKPVYVFDGKPPQLKRDELDRRGGRRDEAEDELKKAQEAGDQEAIERFSKRTVKVTKDHVEDCKKLLTMMGVPYVEVLPRANMLQTGTDHRSLRPAAARTTTASPVATRLSCQ